MHFDGWGRIVGSYTSNYLLEKSRVTSPEKGARLATLNTSLPLTDPLQPLAAPYSPYTPYSTVHPLQASAATISSICFSLVSLLQSCRRLRPPTPSIMHMHCTCTAHALHMHYTCICTAHALHMQARRLAPLTEQPMLTRSGCVEVEGRDERKEWAEMLEAMGRLGIGAAEQKQIFDVVAAVLHLGRVQFASDKSQVILSKYYE